MLRHHGQTKTNNHHQETSMKKTGLFTRRGLVTTLAAIITGPALCLSAAAQSWPTKPVKIVVNFPPGGAADQIARAIGVPLGEALGQPVVVENRGGANGNLGGEVVAKSPADGYTLLMSSGGMVSVNPHIYARMPFDPAKDLVPVASAGQHHSRIFGPCEGQPRPLVVWLGRQRQLAPLGWRNDEKPSRSVCGACALPRRGACASRCSGRSIGLLL
jgi:hypothetical protein